MTTNSTPKPRTTGRKQGGQLVLIPGFNVPAELAEQIAAGVTGKGGDTLTRRKIKLLQLGLHYERMLKESERPNG